MKASQCPVAKFEGDICNQGYPYKRCIKCGTAKTNTCRLTQENLVSETASAVYHGKSYEEVAIFVAPKIRDLVRIELAKRIDKDGNVISPWHTAMMFAYVLVSIPSIVYAGSELIRHFTDKLG